MIDLGQQKPPQSGLEAHWLSKYNHPATDDGLIPSKIGDDSRLPVSGGALSFDGVDDIATTSLNPSVSTNVSVSFWFNISNTTSTYYHVTYEKNAVSRSFIVLFNGLANSLLSFGFFKVNGEGSYTRASLVEFTNTWTHCAMTFNNGTVKIYFNGIEQSTTNSGTGLRPTVIEYNINNVISIGESNPSAFFRGQTFDVRFWNNKTLSQSEVTSVYNRNYLGDEYFCWKCDEGSGTTIYDSSNNARNATLSGSPTRTTQNIYSFSNEEGYTDSSGVRIPKSNTSNFLDVQGNPLQYKGKVSYPAQLVQSSCIQIDTVDDRLRFSSLSGITITSYGGTATLSISGNDILATVAGTVYNLVLSNGNHYPLSEGNGTICYSSNGGANITLIGGVTRTTQGVYHHNFLNKHWEYSNGSLVIRSPIDLTGVEPSGYALTRVVQGSRYHHNGCETKINFNPYSAPKTSALPTAYVFGTEFGAANGSVRKESNKESNFLIYGNTPYNSKGSVLVLNNYIKGANTTLEPEVVITLDRMTVKPSAARALLYNDLIREVKLAQGLTLGTNNLSTVFKTFYIRASHDYNEGLKNWASTSFDSTAVNSPIFTVDRGYKSNGTTSYLDWNFNPNTQSLLNNCHYGIYSITDLAAANNGLYGRFRSSDGQGFTVNPKNGSNNYRAALFASTQFLEIASSSSIGLFSQSKDATAQYSIWKNGALLLTSTTATVQNTDFGNIYELALNDFTIGAAATFGTREVAISYAATNGIDANMSGIYTAMRNYLLQLGITGI